MNSPPKVGYPILILLLIGIFACILSLFIIEGFLEYRHSKLLNRKIGIQETLPKSKEAFDMIEQIYYKIFAFVKRLQIDHPDNEDVQRLARRLNKVEIEESENKEGISSYTINKGELMSICVRHKEELSKIHDMNTMLFVLIHEIAHVMSVTEGHNAEFMKNFKFLLKEAAKQGFYSPVDYSSNNITYCGVKVTNNPYY